MDDEDNNRTHTEFIGFVAEQPRLSWQAPTFQLSADASTVPPLVAIGEWTLATVEIEFPRLFIPASHLIIDVSDGASDGPFVLLTAFIVGEHDSFENASVAVAVLNESMAKVSFPTMYLNASTEGQNRTVEIRVNLTASDNCDTHTCLTGPTNITAFWELENARDDSSAIEKVLTLTVVQPELETELLPGSWVDQTFEFVLAISHASTSVASAYGLGVNISTSDAVFIDPLSVPLPAVFPVGTIVNIALNASFTSRAGDSEVISTVVYWQSQPVTLILPFGLAVDTTDVGVPGPLQAIRLVDSDDDATDGNALTVGETAHVVCDVTVPCFAVQNLRVIFTTSPGLRIQNVTVDTTDATVLEFGADVVTPQIAGDGVFAVTLNAGNIYGNCSAMVTNATQRTLSIGVTVLVDPNDTLHVIHGSNLAVFSNVTYQNSSGYNLWNVSSVEFVVTEPRLVVAMAASPAGPIDRNDGINVTMRITSTATATAYVAQPHVLLSSYVSFGVTPTHSGLLVVTSSQTLEAVSPMAIPAGTTTELFVGVVFPDALWPQDNRIYVQCVVSYESTASAGAGRVYTSEGSLIPTVSSPSIAIAATPIDTSDALTLHTYISEAEVQAIDFNIILPDVLSELNFTVYDPDSGGVGSYDILSMAVSYINPNVLCDQPAPGPSSSISAPLYFGVCTNSGFPSEGAPYAITVRTTMRAHLPALFGTRLRCFGQATYRTQNSTGPFASAFAGVAGWLYEASAYVSAPSATSDVSAGTAVTVDMVLAGTFAHNLQVELAVGNPSLAVIDSVAVLASASTNPVSAVATTGVGTERLTLDFGSLRLADTVSAFRITLRVGASSPLGAVINITSHVTYRSSSLLGQGTSYDNTTTLWESRIGTASATFGISTARVPSAAGANVFGVTIGAEETLLWNISVVGRGALTVDIVSPKFLGGLSVVMISATGVAPGGAAVAGLAGTPTQMDTSNVTHDKLSLLLGTLSPPASYTISADTTVHLAVNFRVSNSSEIPRRYRQGVAFQITLGELPTVAESLVLDILQPSVLVSYQTSAPSIGADAHDVIAIDMVVHNTGSATAWNITVTPTLSAGLQSVNGTTGMSAFASMPPGASETVSFAVKVVGSGIEVGTELEIMHDMAYFSTPHEDGHRRRYGDVSVSDIAVADVNAALTLVPLGAYNHWNAASVVAGESVDVRLSLTLPEGTASSWRVSLTLQNGDFTGENASEWVTFPDNLNIAFNDMLAVNVSSTRDIVYDVGTVVNAGVNALETNATIHVQATVWVDAWARTGDDLVLSVVSSHGNSSAPLLEQTQRVRLALVEPVIEVVFTTTGLDAGVVAVLDDAMVDVTVVLNHNMLTSGAPARNVQLLSFDFNVSEGLEVVWGVPVQLSQPQVLFTASDVLSTVYAADVSQNVSTLNPRLCVRVDATWDSPLTNATVVGGSSDFTTSASVCLELQFENSDDAVAQSSRGLSTAAVVGLAMGMCCLLTILFVVIAVSRRRKAQPQPLDHDDVDAPEMTALPPGQALKLAAINCSAVCVPGVMTQDRYDALIGNQYSTMGSDRKPALDESAYGNETALYGLTSDPAAAHDTYGLYDDENAMLDAAVYANKERLLRNEDSNLEIYGLENGQSLTLLSNDSKLYANDVRQRRREVVDDTDTLSTPDADQDVYDVATRPDEDDRGDSPSEDSAIYGLHQNLDDVYQNTAAAGTRESVVSTLSFTYDNHNNSVGVYGLMRPSVVDQEVNIRTTPTTALSDGRDTGLLDHKPLLQCRGSDMSQTSSTPSASHPFWRESTVDQIPTPRREASDDTDTEMAEQYFEIGPWDSPAQSEHLSNSPTSSMLSSCHGMGEYSEVFSPSSDNSSGTSAESPPKLLSARPLPSSVALATMVPIHPPEECGAMAQKSTPVVECDVNLADVPRRGSGDPLSPPGVPAHRTTKFVSDSTRSSWRGSAAGAGQPHEADHAVDDDSGYEYTETSPPEVVHSPSEVVISPSSPPRTLRRRSPHDVLSPDVGGQNAMHPQPHLRGTEEGGERSATSTASATEEIPRAPNNNHNNSIPRENVLEYATIDGESKQSPPVSSGPVDEDYNNIDRFGDVLEYATIDGLSRTTPPRRANSIATVSAHEYTDIGGKSAASTAHRRVSRAVYAHDCGDVPPGGSHVHTYAHLVPQSHKIKSTGMSRSVSMHNPTTNSAPLQRIVYSPVGEAQGHDEQRLLGGLQGGLHVSGGNAPHNRKKKKRMGFKIFRGRGKSPEVINGSHTADQGHTDTPRHAQTDIDALYARSIKPSPKPPPVSPTLPPRQDASSPRAVAALQQELDALTPRPTHAPATTRARAAQSMYVQGSTAAGPPPPPYIQAPNSPPPTLPLSPLWPSPHENSASEDEADDDNPVNRSLPSTVKQPASGGKERRGNGALWVDMRKSQLLK